MIQRRWILLRVSFASALIDSLIDRLPPGDGCARSIVETDPADMSS